MIRLRHLAPVLVLAALIVTVRATWLQHYASFSALGQQQAALRSFVALHPVLAPAAYMGLYAAMVALSLPVGLLMSTTGGLLFGLGPGSCYAVASAAAGAVAVFMLARTVAGPLLERRTGPLMKRVPPGLERDGFSYLLALRLLPVVPFWVTNLAPAFAGMRLAPYAAATLLGIVPATCVFVSLGAGLGDTLAAGQRPDGAILFSPQVLLPLVGLAGLALAPIGWRHWRARHA